MSQIELEKIVGSLIIAQYQEDRLRSRLGDRIVSGVGSATNRKASTHTFKHRNKWYKIMLKLDELINERRHLRKYDDVSRRRRRDQDRYNQKRTKFVVRTCKDMQNLPYVP